MLNFDPSRIEAKCEGRDILANIAGIPLEEAAIYFVDATHQNFQSCFNAFTTKFPKQAKIISDSRPDGVGPGEMLAWFIFNNLTLGGKNASLDLMVDGKPFAEMKGGAHTQCTNTLDNFKITKDTDRAVTVIQDDLRQFNDTYNRITGNDLPGWSGLTSVKVTALKMWETLNLTRLQKITPPKMVRRYVGIEPDGRLINEDDEALGHMDDVNLHSVLTTVLLTPPKCTVDPAIDTLQKVINRWSTQAYSDYVAGKNIALINVKTMEMVFFGEIPKRAISLYCVNRNQPWARILIDKL